MAHQRAAVAALAELPVLLCTAVLRGQCELTLQKCEQACQQSRKQIQRVLLKGSFRVALNQLVRTRCSWEHIQSAPTAVLSRAGRHTAEVASGPATVWAFLRKRNANVCVLLLVHLLEAEANPDALPLVKRPSAHFVIFRWSGEFATLHEVVLEDSAVHPLLFQPAYHLLSVRVGIVRHGPDWRWWHCAQTPHGWACIVADRHAGQLSVDCGCVRLSEMGWGLPVQHDIVSLTLSA